MLDHPGNTPMRARIEVKHTMCTWCANTSNFCQHCSSIYKEIAPFSKEVNKKNKKKVKAPEVSSTKKLNVDH